MKKISSFITKHDILLLTGIAGVLSIVSIWYYFVHGQIISYGDAESHLNIAKRVVSSLTPGLAQLGGIWLPLPHLLMAPFVFFDPLWRSGLAGSIVSGISYVISAIFLYKFVSLITKKKIAGLIAFVVFATNPNILYMQSTPMTELLLIAFFILSTYYFYRFLIKRSDTLSLLNAAFFGFAASLTRYDGWFLILIEALIIVLLYIKHKEARKKLEGKFILFCTLAFFGVVLWVLWNFLILGNPLYFMNSPFSAKSQQQNWIGKGELETYKNLWLSFLYYAATSYANIGMVTTIFSLMGLVALFLKKSIKESWLLVLLLSVPFLFYVITLYLGQSVIFIPSLTPAHYEWHLFNVRYGLMMVPVAAILIGVLFSYRKIGMLLALLGILLQISMTILYPSTPITLQDGTVGLSAARITDAQRWMDAHYTGGLVLLDDYARSMSIIRSTIPMNQIIYVGNKPYYDESLIAPEKYAHWIIMQKGDSVWENLYDDSNTRGRLFKYFKKTYTSPELLIFERNEEEVAI